MLLDILAETRRMLAPPWEAEEQEFAVWRAARLLTGVLIGTLAFAIKVGTPIATHKTWGQIIVPQWLPGTAGAIPFQPEILFVVAAALLVFKPTWTFIRRFIRSWWNGLHSLLLPTGAFGAWAISTWPRLPVTTMVVAVAIVLLFVEFTRCRVDYSRKRFAVPLFGVGGAKAETHWHSSKSDEPITHSGQDLVGRSATLELLARCVLEERMSIVALKGAYGDGKTSVLNLLGNELAPLALVVSFKAWLPNSETDFASALLRDISLTVNKYLYVPNLRRRTLAFFRIIAGSRSQFGGVKELLPTHTQADEFQALVSILKRIPRPVVVLVDEIDRMEAAEVFTLFKILRGAHKLPNISFICSFSDLDLRRILKAKIESPDDYLEKFFPASIRLPAPSQELIGGLLFDRVNSDLEFQGAFPTVRDQEGFRADFAKVWKDCLHGFVRNLRGAGRLAVAVNLAHGPIKGEVEPLDVILLEALRLVFPAIYEEVRLNGNKLTEIYDPFDRMQDGRKQFIQELERQVTPQSNAHRVLGWLFPDYGTEEKWRYKRTSEKAQRRVWKEDRFQIYFRSDVPYEIFSEAETKEVLDDLRKSQGVEGALLVLQERFASLSDALAKRADFLARLRLRLSEIPSEIIHNTAVAVCRMASEFHYDDGWGFAEAGQALQIVEEACKGRIAEEERATLVRAAILAVSDDKFAYRLVTTVAEPTNPAASVAWPPSFTNAAKKAFVERMRERYTPETTPNMEFSDHQAFRKWMDLEKGDVALVMQFFESYVGTGAKRLAQVAAIVYPNAFWTSDPREIVGRFLPLETMKAIITGSPHDDLTTEELEEFKRLELFVVYGEYIAEPGGRYVTLPGFTSRRDVP